MAADSFSAILGLLEQGTGNNNNTWGALLNTGALDQVDLAVAGRSARSVTGGTLDLSGTPPPAGPSGAIHAYFDFTGTLASNQIVQVPNLSKIWVVRNSCALAGFTLTFKTPSGTASAAIPNGRVRVICDGANNILVDLSTSLRDTQWAGADGTVGAPGLSFSGDTDTGLYRIGANNFGAAVGGVKVTDFSSDGIKGGVFLNWVASGGTSDAITATYAPVVPALVDGLLCCFRATAANATTTPTFAPNGLTAATITKKGGGALVIADIPGNLAEVILRYNLANTVWELLNPASVAAPPAGSFKNLSIKVASNTTVTVVADSVVTTDGTTSQTTAVNATCNLGSNGAVNRLDTGTIAIDSWYAIWVIAKPDGTTGTLASLSATAPTMPTGYTFKARLGWVRTIHASATLYGTWQFGRLARYVVGLAQTSTYLQMSSASTAWPTAVAWATFAPSTASHIDVIMSGTGVGTQIIIQADSTNSPAGTAANPTIGEATAFSTATVTVSNSVSLMLTSANIYWGNAGTSTQFLFAAGWTDNI